MTERNQVHDQQVGNRRRRTLAVLSALVLVAAVAACGSGGSMSGGSGTGEVVEVTVLDNSFNPEILAIKPGTTVRWRNKGKLDHNSIVPEGNLKFGVEAKDFGPGKTHEFTFTEKGEYRYYCSLHGTEVTGMIGKIVVTDNPSTVVTATTRPFVDQARAGDGEIRRVPQQYPTIQGAVDASKPGDMVFVGKGTYHEAVKVTTSDIVIRGEDRNETILDGRYELSNGVLVSGANGVAVENMTARNYTVNGFFWTGVQGYRGSYLTAIRNGDYGLYGFDSRYGQFDHSLGTGSPDAGFYIGQCYPCDALIVDSLSELNGLGYSGTNAGGNLRIVNSTFRNNRAGIVPNSGNYEKYPPERETTIVGNIVHGNKRDDVPAINAAVLVSGNGIVSAGGNDNVIERNLVYDHAKGGIVLIAIPEDAMWWDVAGNKVRDNNVSGSGNADLALVSDKNLRNCFAGNTFTTSTPEKIEQHAPCDNPTELPKPEGALDLFAFISAANAPSGDYKAMPDPAPQPTMPEAATAPWLPASPGHLPTISVDLARIAVPTKPS